MKSNHNKHLLFPHNNVSALFYCHFITLTRVVMLSKVHLKQLKRHIFSILSDIHT